MYTSVGYRFMTYESITRLTSSINMSATFSNDIIEKRPCTEKMGTSDYVERNKISCKKFIDLWIIYLSGIQF